jgi:Transglycosylase SLT domain
MGHHSSYMKGSEALEEVSYMGSPFVHLTKWVILGLMILAVGIPHLSAGGERGDTVSEEITSVLFGIRGHDNGEEVVHSGDEIPGEETKTSDEENTDAGEMVIPGADSPETMDFVQAEPDPISRALSVLPSRLNLSARPVQMDPVSEHEETPELPFDHIIREVAERYDVEPSLVRAIIMAESSYNPMAVSRKGAIGLMQLMPRTAKALGVEDSFDPELNIDAGVRYFRQLLDQFDGDIKLAIAAYNAGSRKVRMYNGIPPFKYTRYYVAKVMEYHQLYQQ